MNEQLHRSQLISELKAAFPDLTDNINAEFGQLTFEVEAFRKLAQEKINAGDADATRRCFEIANRFYMGGNCTMREVIDTCFVEDLDFANTPKRRRDWAWKLMPRDLQEAYRRFHSGF